MTHHDDVHINYGLGGYRSCICFCEECSDRQARCKCTECSCRDPRFIAPHTPLPETEVTIIEHPCKKCGEEVERKGSRGRWPSMHDECKK